MSDEIAPTTSNLWPLFGHEEPIRRLQAVTHFDIAGPHYGGPSHAYLITGPRHVGKTLLAKTFAQALLCQAANSSPEVRAERPCGRCGSCRLFAAGNHPDFRQLQPLDKNGGADRVNGTLRVEQAAEFIHAAALRPIESQYKVFLIQDLQAANDSFANKILKTLEEPSPSVVICLTATDRSELLPTIVSRCQLVELRPLGTLTIEQMLLERWSVEPAQADLLARLANGRPGWAIRQLEAPQEWHERGEQLEMLQQLITANRVQRLSFAETLATKRSERQLFDLLECWTTWWRDVLLAQSGCVEACCNVDQLRQITFLAERVSPSTVQRHVQILKRVEGYLHHTVNTRLALDMLVLQIPRST